MAGGPTLGPGLRGRNGVSGATLHEAQSVIPNADATDPPRSDLPVGHIQCLLLRLYPAVIQSAAARLAPRQFCAGRHA
jgi:hypothetical protein